MRRLQANIGGAEIRTLGGLTPTTVFKTAALDHSATPPSLKHEKLLKNRKKYILKDSKGNIAEIDKWKLFKNKTKTQSQQRQI